MIRSRKSRRVHRTTSSQSRPSTQRHQQQNYSSHLTSLPTSLQRQYHATMQSATRSLQVRPRSRPSSSITTRKFISTASIHPQNYDPDCPPHPSQFAPSVSELLYDSLEARPPSSKSQQQQQHPTTDSSTFRNGDQSSQKGDHSTPNPSSSAIGVSNATTQSFPIPSSSDHLYTKKVRSVLLVKKWKSKAATQHSNEIASFLKEKGIQVFVEPSCVNDFTQPYPSIFDILHQSDASFPHNISSCFPILDGSTLTSPSTLISKIQTLSNDAQKEYLNHLSSRDFWKDFYRDNRNINALSQLDARECIAFVRKFSKWQEFIDVVIAVGGDGTLLHVSTLFSHEVPPVLGFSCGSFGFLMPFNPMRYQSALDRLLSGSLYYQDRNRILFKISSKESRVEGPLDQRDPHCYHLLNEVVLKHSYGLNVSAGVSDIECRVNNHLLARYQGDGLILASPTGSTAYSLAVGGSIIHPSMKCLLISPIAPMTLSSRPLILPPDSIVTLSPVNNPVLLEGKFGRVVRPGEVIHITESMFPIPVFCRKDATSDFIHDLGTRLNYSRMVRFKRDDDDVEDAPSGPSGSFVAKRDEM